MSIYHSKNRYAQSGAYYALHLDRFDMPTHQHERCEIMYVVEGHCFIETEHANFELLPKQFVFLDQQVAHRLLIQPDTPCVLLNYEFGCSEEHLGVDLFELAERSPGFQQFLQTKAPCLVLHDRGKLGYALKDLIGELEESGDPYLLELLLRRMLLELARCAAKETAITGIGYLKRAKQYIAEHLLEELNVSQIAAFAGINHSYLQTLFAKHLGCGIMTYVNHQRMDRATFLLKNSNMQITDIAFEVGFNSRQHFGYTFEKRFGMSPRQYRILNSQNIATDTGTEQQTLEPDGSRGTRYSLK